MKVDNPVVQKKKYNQVIKTEITDTAKGEVNTR